MLFNGSEQMTAYAETRSEDYVFHRSWGGEGDKILSPQGVAWGKDGIFYFANSALHRITYVTTKDNTFNVWGFRGFGSPLEFQSTYGVTVDGNGFVYSTDGNGQITKTTSSGDYITHWLEHGARGIASSPEGYIYVLKEFVSNWDDHYLHIFDNNGLLINKWGSAGSSPGNLYFPKGVFVTSDAVYIADTGNNRIQKFTHNGDFRSSWGSLGSEVGQFNKPEGITVDASGNIYVADTGNHRIQVFDNTGNFIRTWGSLGSSKSEFNHPVGLSINQNGVLLVSDKNNNRIQMFKLDGIYLGEYGDLMSYSSAHNFLGPIAIDANYNVFIADNENFNIQKFNKNLELIQVWDIPNQIRIWDLEFDPENYLYAICGGKIQKYDLSGDLIEEWSACSEGTARGIAFDLSGSVFVNCWSSLLKLDETGNIITSLSHPSDEWISISGVAVDGVGNVYVSDPNFSTIYQFDNDGNFIKTIGTFFGPTGMAAFMDRIFIADQFGNRVYIYNSNGDYLTDIGSKGVGPGEFIWPEYISTYNGDEIFVVDGIKLQEFSTNTHSGIQNGSFESSPALIGWTYGGILSISRSLHSAHGSYSLQLGQPVSQAAQDQGKAWAHQTFYVRPEMDQPTLWFRYNMFVNDIVHYSDFFVAIQDGVGLNHLETVLRDGYPGTVAPPAGTNMGWRTARFDLSAYKGQHIRLVFSNRNLWPNSWGIWTYVDDVRVVEEAELPPEHAVFLPLVTR